MNRKRSCGFFIGLCQIDSVVAFKNYEMLLVQIAHSLLENLLADLEFVVNLVGRTLVVETAMTVVCLDVFEQSARELAYLRTAAVL